MTTSAAHEHELIGDIYDAAMAPKLWPSVLQKIAAIGECNSAVILTLDTLNPDYTLSFSHNIPDHAMQAYRDEKLDVLEMELHGKPMIQRGIGHPILVDDLYPSHDEYIQKAGKFYELCLKASNIRYMASTLLDYSDFRWAVIGIHRPEDWPAMNQDNAAFVARMGLHIRRALQIHRQVISVEQKNALLYGLLNELTTGVILISHQGKLRFANKKAEHILRTNHSLRPCAAHGLKAALPDQTARLQQLIQGAIYTGLRANTQLTSGVIGLHNEIGEHPLMLTVVPLSEMTGYGELASDGIAAAVFLTDPNQKNILSRKLLKHSFGLTERESDLCQAFINHASLEGVAADCGLTLSSTRSYFKEVYAKTDQHSQPELIRLLTGLKLDFDHIT